MLVDELVVTLGLDASKFTDEQKKALEAFNKSQDAIDKRLKQLEERNKKSAQSFGDATHAAEGLFTALAGAGLVAFSRDIVNSAAGAGRMATNIGIATNELSAFGRMIERNGGNADAAAGSMKGLADSMQRMKWGEVSRDFLLGLSQVGGTGSDSPLQLFFKLAKFAETHNAQEVQQTAQRLGLSMEIANVAIKGGVRALEEYRKAGEGALSPDQVRRLTEMQEAWVKLDQTIRTTGNDVVTGFAPSFVAGADAVSKFAAANRGFVSSIAGIVAALAGLKGISWVLRLLGLGFLFSPVTAVGAAGAGLAGVAANQMANNKSLQKAYTDNPALSTMDPDAAMAAAIMAVTEGNAGTTSAAAAPGAGPSAFESQRDKEAFIRASAARAGISPDTAMAVARSEGFSSFRSSIPDEQSFGAFQLHVTPGGRGRAVGDLFREKTGLDPADPANERAGIEFALKWAREHGWGDFHGAANTGISRWDGIQRGTSVTVGDVNITTDSKDPREHGRLVASEIRSRLADSGARDLATSANSGQRQ